tara:strand:+ start:2356 stop:3186 length:831 start_codon:yes stop_codon:yes gene_type:complete
MGKDLTIKNLKNSLSDVKPEYKTMLKNIENKMPSVLQACSNFHKSHSQFMGVTVDVTAITPIRSVKHTLAEINKTKLALQENQIVLEKLKIKLKKKKDKLSRCKNTYNIELLRIEIIELETKIINANDVIQGAIRKLNFFMNQYDNLLNHLGVDEITEEMYEKEENRYHIMTCMKQALISARPRGGIIDEGNMIYLFDIGINGAEAQLEVVNYLNFENNLLKKGEMPTHEDTMKWLESCADKFENNPQKFAERRGFKLLDEQSLTNKPQLENKTKH